MKKLCSVLFKALAPTLVALVALTSIIPVSAEGSTDRPNSSTGRVYPTYTIIDLSDGTVPISPYAYEMEKAWNETYAGKPVSGAEWELAQQLKAQLKYWTPSLTLKPSPVTQPTRSGSVTIGTDEEFYSGDHGQAGWSGAWYGSHYESYDIPNLIHDTRVTLALAGSIESGATTGQTFSVNGSGSATAYFDIYGWAGGYLATTYYGAAYWEVKAELWDITGSVTLVETSVIFYDGVAMSYGAYVGGYYNNTFSADLQANHTYFVRLFTTTQVNVLTGDITNNVADAATDDYRSEWYHVDISWE